MKTEAVSFVYPLDRERKPSGYTIAVLVREGRIFTGSSLCGPKDQYNKKVGRAVAHERALEAFQRWETACKARKEAARLQRKMRAANAKSKKRGKRAKK